MDTSVLDRYMNLPGELRTHQLLKTSATVIRARSERWPAPCRACARSPVSYTHLTLPTICSV
eukprot:6055257-Prymnesium_polylepis.3